MHSYTVEFRISSEKEAIDIDAINKDLGITATNTRKKGDIRSSSSVFNESMWGYDTCKGKDRDSLEKGLESLLEVLMPLKDKIMRYCEKYDAVFWCGHFTSSFDGGPTFSPELLRKLGEFGVGLFLDTYCSADEEQTTF
jgi:hypothetical protein